MFRDFIISTAIVLAFIFDQAIWLSTCVIAGFSVLFAVILVLTGVDMAAYELFEIAILALINSVIFYKIYAFFYDQPLLKRAYRTFCPERSATPMAA